MPPDSYKPVDANLVRSIVAESKASDYDGHTEFSRLTPQQRLEWLDHAVVFIEAAQRSNEGSSATAPRMASLPKNTSA